MQFRILVSLLAVTLTAQASPLLHHYIFNFGSVIDQAGSVNGTLKNGATAAGGFLTLDGTDDYVEFANRLVPLSGDMAVSLWAVERANTIAWVEFISQGESGSGFYVGRDPDSGMRVSDSWTSTGVAMPNDLTLHQYVVSVAGSITSLYIDGVLANTLSSDIARGPTGSNTFFGKQFAPHAEHLGGSLADVRIYGAALTPAEVSSLFREGADLNTPEPGSLGLCLMAAAALAASRLRRA